MCKVKLGLCYLNGIGTPKSEAGAAKAFGVAAKENDAVALYNLGWCYSAGLGVEQNHAKSFECYEAAAKQGYVNAQCNLGSCYVRILTAFYCLVQLF